MNSNIYLIVTIKKTKMKKFKHVNSRLINLPVPITQLQQIRDTSYFMDPESTSSSYIILIHSKIVENNFL